MESLRLTTLGAVRALVVPNGDRLLHQPEADLEELPPVSRSGRASFRGYLVSLEFLPPPPGRQVDRRDGRQNHSVQALSLGEGDLRVERDPQPVGLPLPVTLFQPFVKLVLAGEEPVGLDVLVGQCR